VIRTITRSGIDLNGIDLKRAFNAFDKTGDGFIQGLNSEMFSRHTAVIVQLYLSQRSYRRYGLKRGNSHREG
jgi:hypothetical protein